MNRWAIINRRPLTRTYLPLFLDKAKLSCMEESDELKLLTEIRDAQREHLAEYRKVTQESLALQKQAVARQEQIVKLYRRVVLAGGAVILLVLIFLFYYVFSLR